MTHPALARLSKAEQALASAEHLPDIKKIIDVAEAARVYARAAKIGASAARHAETIKLRAQRKAGECLAKLKRGKRGPKELKGKLPRNSEYKQTIKDEDIEETAAKRWQRVAAIPEPEFNKYLATEDEAKELSTAGLLRECRRKPGAKRRQYVPVAESFSIEGQCFFDVKARIDQIFFDLNTDQQEDLISSLRQLVEQLSERTHRKSA